MVVLAWSFVPAHGIGIAADRGVSGTRATTLAQAHDGGNRERQAVMGLFSLSRENVERCGGTLEGRTGRSGGALFIARIPTMEASQGAPFGLPGARDRDAAS